MNKKLVIVLLTSLFNLLGYSQNGSIKDTISLEQVNVKMISVKKKTVSYETKGRPAYNGLQRVEKMVCLMTDLPKGKLKSAKFYFNCGLINLLHKKLDINYRDVKLGLIIYNVSDKGFPSEVISENEIEFIITAEHRGSFEINMEKLKLQSQDMFIGFSVLSETFDDENNIYIRFNENDEARSFVIYKNHNVTAENQWRNFANYSFKTEMNIEL